MPHVNCHCWCHSNTQDLLVSPKGPEYDLTPPPEFANSADAAFIEDGTLADRSLSTKSAFIEEPEYLKNEMVPENTASMESVSPFLTDDALFSDQDFSKNAPPAASYANRSPGELARNKCDTCGDKLAVCECVE